MLKWILKEFPWNFFQYSQVKNLYTILLKNVNEIIVLGNGDNDDHDSGSSIIGVGNLKDLEMNGILDQAM